MKQLNTIQSAIFITGGILMVVGVACCVLTVVPTIMCWVYILGAVMFATMQVSQFYEGNKLAVRRLKKLQSLSDLLFVLAGVLLADTVYAGTGHSFFKSMFSNQEAYITYLYNKWVILLLVAAVLEVYTSHRIEHELSQKNIKE